uniref:Uncharacterized protein n=1 Tax=viral metagenome TaxID=1070528 RepID=A0A6C0JBY8_9ZZZZ|tara:strand:- start:1737 stop:2666 length:930 start_codon:yes stop_codon:yes gene_type:complete
MINRKQVCEASRTCETGKTFNGSSAFFLMPIFNNRFAPKFVNSRTDIINGNIKNLNTERTNSGLCNTDTKQQRLSIRHKPTPYRVPYNHYRKSYTCSENCLENEKIVKDTVVGCDENGDEICKKTNYTKTRLVNKFGFRNTNNGGNYKNYLQTAGKLYEQNAFGILPENKANTGIFKDKQNLYKINTVNGSVDSDCKIAYEIAGSLKGVNTQQQRISTATRKWANPGFNSRTSVNSRNRTQRLKYNAEMGGQRNAMGTNYNNCINGQECSKYVSPGPNTKLFSFTLLSRNGSTCNASRINGMKQSCNSL